MTNRGVNLNPWVDFSFWITDKHITINILILEIGISQERGKTYSGPGNRRVKAHIIKLISEILNSWRKLNDPCAIRLWLKRVDVLTEHLILFLIIFCLIKKFLNVIISKQYYLLTDCMHTILIIKMYKQL
jgi:hypothetical protein